MYQEQETGTKIVPVSYSYNRNIVELYHLQINITQYNLISYIINEKRVENKMLGYNIIGIRLNLAQPNKIKTVCVQLNLFKSDRAAIVHARFRRARPK